MMKRFLSLLSYLLVFMIFGIGGCMSPTAPVAFNERPTRDSVKKARDACSVAMKASQAVYSSDRDGTYRPPTRYSKGRWIQS
jgi:hypothetical protein